MKRSTRLLYSATLLAALMFFGRSPSAFAAESGGGPGDRLERLERRVNEMAEQQEQLMRRLGAPMERQPAMGAPGNDRRRLERSPTGAPLPAMQPQPGVRLAKGLHDLVGLLILIGIICNILLAVWIYTDIRKRGCSKTGSWSPDRGLYR